MDDLEQAKLEVRFFRTQAGVEPVRKWLRALNLADKKIIGEDIKTVQFGWPIGMPLVRHLGDGIWEVRSNLSQGIARVLFFMSANMIVLVHGFIKKTQKTPAQEIALAKKRMKQFIGSSHH